MAAASCDARSEFVFSRRAEDKDASTVLSARAGALRKASVCA